VGVPVDERDTTGHATATRDVVADFLEFIELAAAVERDSPDLRELRSRAPRLVAAFQDSPERFFGVGTIDPDLWAELRELMDLAARVRVRL
jgi:hypothetical protein